MLDKRNYQNKLVSRMWDYAANRIPASELEAPGPKDLRPPVLSKQHAESNVLALAPHRKAVLALLPRSERHRWFRSMKSSQALAQSVFGNLIAQGRLDLLEAIKDNGSPVFRAPRSRIAQAWLEHTVTTLNEPRPTSVDVMLELSTPGYRVAIECKLAEIEFGSCSRPRLDHADPEHCDGTYRRQSNRSERCSLTELGVEYWRHIPSLFKWRNDVDADPCPLRETYQLVRNILAARVGPGGELAGAGHAVVVYDERNPAFQLGGAAAAAYADVKRALLEPSLLRRCSWQTIARHLRAASAFRWLADELDAKYGIVS